MQKREDETMEEFLQRAEEHHQALLASNLAQRARNMAGVRPIPPPERDKVH